MNRLNQDIELLWYWSRPTPDMQSTLFSDPIDQVLASLQVSRDDVKRWQAKGWISFDIDDMNVLDWTHFSEIEFIRNIARSGLLDAQLNSLLKELPKPYRFKREKIAYHFTSGWVVSTVDDLDKMVQRYIASLYENGETEQLQDLAATTCLRGQPRCGECPLESMCLTAENAR